MAGVVAGDCRLRADLGRTAEKDFTTEDIEDTEYVLPRTILGDLRVLGGS